MERLTIHRRKRRIHLLIPFTDCLFCLVLFQFVNRCKSFPLHPLSSTAVRRAFHHEDESIVSLSSSPSSSSGDDDDGTSRSTFGTKEYWDEIYLGRGDFPADEYSWYFGFDTYQRFVQEYVKDKTVPILIPGIGNDPLLLSLLQKGYTNLTATDYSEFALERQRELLGSQQYPDDAVELRCMDARRRMEDTTWTNRFSVILEKGALDAIYLSGDGHLESTVREFERILIPGGILISVSGVVPEDLRRHIFLNWNWLEDGSDDLKAGCFVLQYR